MSQLLDQVIARAKALPFASQDEAASLSIDWFTLKDTGRDLQAMPSEYRRAVDEGLDDVARGRLASPGDVVAAFRMFTPND